MAPIQENLDLEPAAPRGGGRPPWVKPAAIGAAVLVAAVAAVAYRSHHRQKVLREGMARAQALARADTATGYREAARLLEPLAKLDPVEAGALRAFALGMLAADYRDAKAGEEAEAILVEPGRAPVVPEPAQLAYAALALSRQEVGNATAFAARAPGPMGLALQARTSLLAGNLGAAAEPLARAVEADPTLPAALALRGDVQRRSGQVAEARASYQAALTASPEHPRAAFGLAKLALSGHADGAAAREALGRLLDDREGMPRAERGRAALHLAALQARAGDRAGAGATLDKAGLEPPVRAWAEKAVADLELHRGSYRVAAGTPAPLVSASDDDPYVAPPPPPPETPRAAAAKAVVKKAKAVPARKKGKAPAKPAKKKADKKKAKAKPKAKPKAKKAPAKKPAAKKPAPKPKDE